MPVCTFGETVIKSENSFIVYQLKFHFYSLPMPLSGFRGVQYVNGNNEAVSGKRFSADDQLHHVSEQVH